MFNMIQDTTQTPHLHDHPLAFTRFTLPLHPDPPCLPVFSTLDRRHAAGG